MAFDIGAKLGMYEILGPLGAGGMGEVYRAHDSRLKRDVAIKLLPAAFASDMDRVARFQREAEALASLNHPHESGRFDVYVQQFPIPKHRIVVSVNGGAQVRWSPDGKELFYIALDGQVISGARHRTHNTDPELESEALRLLSDRPYS